MNKVRKDILDGIKESIVGSVEYWVSDPASFINNEDRCIAWLESEVDKAVQEVTNIEIEKENMKCCGNCKYYKENSDNVIECTNYETEHYDYGDHNLVCEEWVSDDLTRNERRIIWKTTIH